MVCTVMFGCCFFTGSSASESELLLLDVEDDEDEVSDSLESVFEDAVEIDSSLFDEACVLCGVRLLYLRFMVFMESV